MRATAAPATLRLYTSPTVYTTVDFPVGESARTVNSGGKVQVSVDGKSQGSFVMVELVPSATGLVRRPGGDNAQDHRRHRCRPARVLGHHPRAGWRQCRRAVGVQLRGAREVRARHRRGRLRLGDGRRRLLCARGREGPGRRGAHLRRGQERRHPHRQLGRPVLPRLQLRGQVPRHRPGGRSHGRADPHLRGRGHHGLLLGSLRRLHQHLRLVGHQAALHRVATRPLEPAGAALRCGQGTRLGLDLHHLGRQPCPTRSTAASRTPRARR